MRVISTLFIFLYISVSSAQPAKSAAAAKAIDSVTHHLETCKTDSLKVNDLLFLSGQQQDVSNYMKSDSLANAALALSQQAHYNKGIAYSRIYFGLNAYFEGNFAKALEHYFFALDIVDKISDKHGQAIVLNNIGLTYNMIKDYDKALEYYYKGLALKQKNGDEKGTATSLNNIGLVYFKKKIYDSALACFNKSMAIKVKFGDKRGEASTYNNIGDVYSALGRYDSALAEIKKALEIKQAFNDKFGIVSSCISIGQLYLRMGKYEDAEQIDTKGLELAKEIGALDEIQNGEKLLSEVYEKKKDGFKALDHFKAYIDARDSIYNKENTQKSIRAEMNFEFEKQQVAAQAEQNVKDAIEKEKEHRQQIIIYFISGILLLVLGFAIFAYRNYLQKQRVNLELDEKNKKIETAFSIIEEKNTQITDSINYAKTIQWAILPGKEELKKRFPESFLLFKPKDIVSGDFYFIEDKESKTVIAAADCTGHGVPGALMSMIGSEKLREAVAENNSSGQILKELNNGIRTSLKQSNNEGSTRDGMDIALCQVEGMKIEYSGANRPLWIIRNGASEIQEIKPDKKSIGGFTEGDTTFESHTIELNKGDTIYMFSDGYADQFGGADGKKLSTKRFREFICALANKSMAEQKKELSIFIEKWRGKEEQLDDILVIGIRV